MAVSLGADGVFDLPAPAPAAALPREEEHPLLSAAADSPRHAVELAEALAAALGHENHGSLSYSHGFAPALTPPGTRQFPPPFDVWGDLARRLPALYSAGRLRAYVDEELPDLTAEVERPDSTFPRHLALLASNVLGTVLGSYWNIAGVRPPADKKSLPPALYGPWKAIAARYLGKDLGQTGFGMYEALVLGFEYDDPDGLEGDEEEVFLPPPPRPEHRVPWTCPGRREYDPTVVRVLATRRSCSLTGSVSEKVFFGSFYEMNCRAAPVVRLLVEAQEAAAALGGGARGGILRKKHSMKNTIPIDVMLKLSLMEDPDLNEDDGTTDEEEEAEEEEAAEAREMEEARGQLLAALRALRAIIDTVTFETFASIQQMSASATHVNAAHWSKLAPIFDPVVARSGEWHARGERARAPARQGDRARAEIAAGD